LLLRQSVIVAVIVVLMAFFFLLLLLFGVGLLLLCCDGFLGSLWLWLLWRLVVESMNGYCCIDGWLLLY